MSRSNTLHNIVYSVILALLSLPALFTGCTDDFIFNSDDIPDVDVEIQGEVIFKPLVTAEVQTRAEGPAGSEYKGIKSLYIFFFNSKRELEQDYCGFVDFTPVPSDGSTHEHVSFTKKVKSGRYYIFAVANLTDEDIERLGNVNTIENLRRFRVDWNDDISKDLEMFGVFRPDNAQGTPDNEGFEGDELLTVTPASSRIHSWVRRAVSKVTVGFDGTNLKDGVTVYIKNARLVDVADGVLLGTTPSAVGVNDIGKAQSQYILSYGAGDDHNAWPTVTRTKSFSPSDVWSGANIADFHDENARALPCYENMQGEPEGKSKLQDSDGDGKIDSDIYKDGVTDGTYLEVEGYYVANRPEYKSQGKIIYRFMLGKDAVKNFDVVRNHHYKITMRFKDYGSDIDWHIEYAEKYFDATYPQDVNYQGKFFTPDLDYTNSVNAGHEFDDKNKITVTSFETDGTFNSWNEPEISYNYYIHNDETGGWDADNSSSGWLQAEVGPVSVDGTQKQYTFVASMTKPESVKINSLFPTSAVGSKTSPYNLSNGNGGSMVENTANCYMVGAPGWYCLPLVYGNAISGGKTNASAYSSTHIVNHIKKNITKPYIKDNPGIDLSDVSVKLIWQDAENLITPGDIIYDSSLFGGKGGIKFHIGTMREGNAVIALIDNKAGEDEYVNIDRGTIYGKSGSTKAVWSWHIWATRFGTSDFENDIRIHNHNEKEYDVMPVNLGWCSGDKEIRYYKRRKCEIRFKVGDNVLTRTIEQYPHFVLPRGDHPYYQWGRKDPFVGTNLAFGNKPRWDHNGKKYEQYGDYNPPRLYQEPKQYQYNAGRKHTQDCLDVLVKNPDKWHNGPRSPLNPDDFTAGFYSINKAFDDLWSIGGKKTVYDPCPPGYQVGDSYVFTGFTVSGRDEVLGLNWYDVLEKNMQSDYYAGSSINAQVLELYTDPRKIQSITFPVTGYRDYDNKAEVSRYPSGNYNGEGYVWFSTVNDQTKSYHLKFIRNDLNGGDWKSRGTLIAIFESFYNTDGFGVRPVRSVPK